MKLVKSLLLGSAAGLAAVTGVQAADLPAKKAAPVEYVRVCSTYGTGFFYVPGTDSCLRISGRLRVDALYRETFTRAQDAFGTRVRARVNFDHRTNTAYGLLRTFIRYEIDRDTSTPFGFQGTIGQNAKIQQGFIQFGGLTAGRATSFFDNPDLPTTHMGTLRFSDAPDVNLIAYTYSFGNGFSATISVEDAQERKVFNAFDFGSRFNGFPVVVNDAGVVISSFSPLAAASAGSTAPDVVANIRYTGTWGGAQLSGAVHQIRDIGRAVLPIVQANGASINLPVVDPITGNALPLFGDTEYGFAASLTGYVNLPFLGAGDSAWVALTYADGANGFILGGGGSNINTANLAGSALPLVDAFVDPFTGDLKTTQAYSVAGGITHNWTPEFRSSIFGSYARFEYSAIASTVNAAGISLGLVDFNEYRIGANTFWSPVAGLNFGVEVLYTNLDPKGRTVILEQGGLAANGAFAVARSSTDAWEGRLRIQRDF